MSEIGEVASPPTRRMRRVTSVARVVAGVLVVLGSAFGGGLGLGSTWESTQENDDYRVSTELITRSQVEIPTNIGTATFDTHAWGPGGRVSVSALALPPVSRQADSPHIDLDAQLDEITDMTVGAAQKSVVKFAIGSVAGGLVGAWAWSGISGWRSRRVWLKSTAVGLVAALGVSGLWGIGAWLTFDEEYGKHLRADGLLAMGLSSERLLAQLNARDQRYAGYVQSLTTYLSRLKESADPESHVPTAARVLLVSDIHSRNIYSQLQRVITSQDIDFVVDAGDLVDWGTGYELSARPDLRQGIASLDVPYVFVKGNHDGPSTVDALREIPTVVILEGQMEEIAGLRLVGVSDPRIYQDGGPTEVEEPTVVEEMEQEAAAEVAEAFGDDPGPVDLAVMHHPAGARQLGEDLSARVWVSGHTHVPALDVGEDYLDITVGTTGAAGIRAFYRQNEEGGVVATQQSFDILDFDAFCRPISLSRFTFPNSLADVGNARVSYETLRSDADDEPAEEDAEASPERSCG
ncbi:MAG: hypothetical protein GEU93_11860 [Propionibacteriales bacterium]|nr:hypothetical protein [Propionibacteriales bacterium]